MCLFIKYIPGIYINGDCSRMMFVVNKAIAKVSIQNKAINIIKYMETNLFKQNIVKLKNNQNWKRKNGMHKCCKWNLKSEISNSTWLTSIKLDQDY